MSHSAQRVEWRFKGIISLIKSLSVPERKRFFKVLEYQPRLFDGTDYVILPKSIADMLQDTIKKVLRREIDVTRELIEISNRLSARNRKPDKTRLERGKIVLKANRDGVSWKKMPSHILKTYPDWFPHYRERRLTLEERQRLGERLRKWARDAEKLPE